MQNAGIDNNNNIQSASKRNRASEPCIATSPPSTQRMPATAQPTRRRDGEVASRGERGQDEQPRVPSAWRRQGHDASAHHGEPEAREDVAVGVDEDPAARRQQGRDGEERGARPEPTALDVVEVLAQQRLARGHHGHEEAPKDGPRDARQDVGDDARVAGPVPGDPLLEAELDVGAGGEEGEEAEHRAEAVP